MKYIFFLLFFVFVTAGVFSLGKKEEKNDNPASRCETGNQTGDGEEKTIKIRGRIQIYGNDPHTFVGIVAENGTEYAVYSPSRENELRRLQGRLIEFTVILSGESQDCGLRGGTVIPVEWEIISYQNNHNYGDLELLNGNSADLTRRHYSVILSMYISKEVGVGSL